MKVSVVIPWRSSGQPERERNVRLTGEHLSQLGPTVLADSSPEKPFSRAGARNTGVSLCLDVPAFRCDVVVVCDADFLPPLDAVLEACESAVADGKLHQPFTEALYLTEAETASYLASGTLPGRSGADLTGGAFVMTPEAWFVAGGMDERFEGWGGEDDAFRVAAETLLGPRVHHQGVMPHLYHPSAAAFGSSAHRGNLALLRRYLQAANNPALMRSLISEWS